MTQVRADVGEGRLHRGLSGDEDNQKSVFYKRVYRPQRFPKPSARAVPHDRVPPAFRNGQPHPRGRRPAAAPQRIKDHRPGRKALPARIGLCKKTVLLQNVRLFLFFHSRDLCARSAGASRSRDWGPLAAGTAPLSALCAVPNKGLVAELESASGSSALQYLSAVGRRHSLSEAVLHFSVALFRLVCSEHPFAPPIPSSPTRFCSRRGRRKRQRQKCNLYYIRKPPRLSSLFAGFFWILSQINRLGRFFGADRRGSAGSETFLPFGLAIFCRI